MKKVLCLAGFIIVILSFKVESQTLTTSLEEYYKFDEASGQQAVNSVNPGVNNSSSVTATTSAAGKINTAFLFNGTSSIVAFADHANWAISATSTISISAWIYLTGDITANGFGCIWGHQNGPELYLNYISAGNYKLGWYTGNTEALTSTLVFSLNTWYHIVLVKNGSTITFYRNGSVVGTVTASDNTIDPPAVYIGSDTHTTPEAFYGRIDELGIWKRVLTANEVTSLYNSGSGLSYPFSNYTLTTSASPTAGGSITLSPSGGTYSSGTTVSATATANSGYTFTVWSGALSGTTNPGTIIMDANKTLTATFTPATTYSLTITTPTNGTITASPLGPNYASGTTVTLSANPASGYQLSAWTGAASGTTNPTTLIMNGNKTVSATFTPTTTYSLTITTPTNGTITASPIGPNYASGTTVTLTANPASGYQFSAWTGAVSGTTNPTTIFMNGNKTVSATFTPTTSATWLNSGNNIYYNSGKVSIGTTIANSASALTVDGKILAKEVEVVSSITADYVFEPEYQLMPLTELEIYLKQNKHLPNIPSAVEFSQQGQNLGKMDDMMLRKIEELTLYIVEQNKKMRKLQQEIDTLKSSQKTNKP